MQESTEEYCSFSGDARKNRDSRHAKRENVLVRKDPGLYGLRFELAIASSALASKPSAKRKIAEDYVEKLTIDRQFHLEFTRSISAVSSCHLRVCGS